jgi:hypothetical protein
MVFVVGRRIAKHGHAGRRVQLGYVRLENDIGVPIFQDRPLTDRERDNRWTLINSQRLGLTTVGRYPQGNGYEKHHRLTSK